jgi:hypothetical protein
MSAETGNGKPGQLARRLFSDIDAPGAYILESTGMLVRIPPDALGGEPSPLITVTGSAPLWTAQLSGDPWISVNRARSIAANNDLTVNF